MVKKKFAPAADLPLILLLCAFENFTEAILIFRQYYDSPDISDKNLD